MEKSKLKLICVALCEFTKAVCDDELISSSSSSSSSDEEDFDVECMILEKENVINSKRVVEVMVDSFNASDFREHFRLTRESVDTIISSIQPVWAKSRGRPPIPCKTAVLMTLWGLANQETYRQLGDRFGLSTGHAHRVFAITTELISRVMISRISWPTKGYAQAVIDQFGSSFPNVMGCLDATHIAIPDPIQNNTYCNRNGFHSVILQIVCDANSKFTDVYCGWPGSALDSSVWRNSPIFKLLSKNPRFIPGNAILLGDNSYELEPFLMVPIAESGKMTQAQKRYNSKLNRTLLNAKQAIGQLKSVFRRLKYVQCQKIENVKDIILSACILHNLRVEEYLEDHELPVEEYLFEEEIPDEPWNGGDHNQKAIQIRNDIVRSFDRTCS